MDDNEKFHGILDGIDVLPYFVSPYREWYEQGDNCDYLKPHDGDTDTKNVKAPSWQYPRCK